MIRIAACCALALAVAIPTATFVSGLMHRATVTLDTRRYDLHLLYASNDYIVDHDLTAQDCTNALMSIRNTRTVGQDYSCLLH